MKFIYNESKGLELASSPIDTINDLRNAKEDLSSVGAFFSDLRSEGFWYALTGEHFGEWCKGLLEAAVTYSDVIVIGALVLLLFVMAGSVRARSYLYWTAFCYLLIKIFGSYL